MAQQKGVDDLVSAYQSLLHPSAELAKNSLTYTQHYLDLKKKVATLNEQDKTAFQNAIGKFSSDSGYERLNALLFEETNAQEDTTQVRNLARTGGAGNVAGASVDSTVKMQVYDKRHKLVQTVQMRPADLQSKMKSDGYAVSAAYYDYALKAITLTLAKSDASGTTAKVTFTTTGDCDMKYKLQEGHSLTLHSVADGSSSVQMTDNRKGGRPQPAQKKK
ncbi:MAG: hypothetical protein ACHQD9_03655 [Chitinophagales bacterium]